MGLLKAIGKLGAKTASRSYTNSQVKNAPSKAYKQTGKEMKKASARGEYIDGSKAYRKNKSNIVRTATRRGKDRETFINDL